MRQAHINYYEKINALLRNSETKIIVGTSAAAAFIIALIINSLFFLDNPGAYITSLKHNYVFNFLTTSILFIISSMVHAYYLFIESKIQYKNRKYYHIQEETGSIYLNIFNLPISFVVSLYLALSFFISLLIFYDMIDNLFTSRGEFHTFFMLFFIIPYISFIYYYYKGIKKIFFYTLYFLEKYFFIINKEVNYEIYISKLNNLDLNLAVISITNLDDVVRGVNKSKGFIFKAIIKQFKKQVKKENFVFPINKKTGIIGFITNAEEKLLTLIIENKILPFMAKDIEIERHPVHIKMKYTIENIGKDQNINNIDDIAQIYGKK